MTTRMVHPQHGATHAYGEGDIARHKALGWSVEVPPAAEPIVEAPAPVAGSNEPATSRDEEKRKPGRPFKAK